MNLKIYSILILALILATACTKETEESTTVIDTPVVEAFLIPGEDVTVLLTKMLPYTEEEYTGTLTIDDAAVFLTHDANTYLLTPVSGSSGNYVCLDTTLNVVPNDVYELEFSYNDYAVSSTTTVPSTPTNMALSATTIEFDISELSFGTIPEPVTVTWDNPENSYHMLVAEYMESSYSPIRDEMPEDQFEQFRVVSLEPDLGEGFDLNVLRQLAFYGTYRIILYKVNQEYVNLYENLGQSTLNLAEPLTNIENGLGIFTAINADTLYLEVEQ